MGELVPNVNLGASTDFADPNKLVLVLVLELDPNKNIELGVDVNGPDVAVEPNVKPLDTGAAAADVFVDAPNVNFTPEPVIDVELVLESPAAFTLPTPFPKPLPSTFTPDCCNSAACGAGLSQAAHRALLQALVI